MRTGAATVSAVMPARAMLNRATASAAIAVEAKDAVALADEAAAAEAVLVFAPPQNYHQFVVMCIDRQTGETMWQHVAADEISHEGHHGSSSFAAASPVTDGQTLYASFGLRRNSYL